MRGSGAQVVKRLDAASAPIAAPRTEFAPRSFADVIARAKLERDRLLVYALERHARLIRFEPGQIEIALTEDAEPDLPQKLMQALRKWTGARWMVAVAQGEGAATVHELRKKNTETLFEEVRGDPLVQKVLARFPGAEIVSVREKNVEQAQADLAEPPIDLAAGERTDDEE